MSKIKSLAEQLKSKLEEQKVIAVKLADSKTIETSVPKKVGAKQSVDPQKLSRFIKTLHDFPMDGQEKILIRIDKRSMGMLRGFKAVSNVDMTRVIVFSLHQFLKSHPWLNEYISQTLNTMTHELD